MLELPVVGETHSMIRYRCFVQEKEGHWRPITAYVASPEHATEVRARKRWKNYPMRVVATRVDHEVISVSDA